MSNAFSVCFLSLIINYSKVGIRGKNIVVLGVEKKSIAKLQDDRTVRKICALDNHVFMAFAGEPAESTLIWLIWDRLALTN